MLIGLTGLAGSGKSLVAQRLTRPNGFIVRPFAGPLKHMLLAAGLTAEQVYGSAKGEVIPDIGKTPRELMQTLGTEWGREMVHPELWVKLWCRQVDTLLAAGGLVVADDVRFPNEVQAIKDRGGVIWRIERPGVTAMGHKSETFALPHDLLIKNDGAVADLREAVDTALSEARGAG